jgi:dienelactone hydrolase
MKLWIAALLLCLTLSAFAGIKTETVEYKHGDTVMEGVMVYDDADSAPRRAVLVVHEWWGLNDYAKKRAEQLAQMGYVAFAVDMYGKGVRAKDVAECQKLSGALKADRPTMRGRINAALSYLKTRKEVDPKKIACMGYCFGGTVSLELARSGAEVAGVISFHGALSTPNPDDAKNIKCRLLVCHGANDPFVPPDEVNAFMEEMKKAKVDCQFVAYVGAVHTFTNPAAGNDPSKGAAYDEKADKRSWEAMKDFFGEIFR